MPKQNCWEFKKCGREPKGGKESELGVCPAATDISANGLNGGKNGGRICWDIAGTLGRGQAQCFFGEDLTLCTSCGFFWLVRKEEGNNFSIIRLVWYK